MEPSPTSLKDEAHEILRKRGFVPYRLFLKTAPTFTRMTQRLEHGIPQHAAEECALNAEWIAILETASRRLLLAPAKYVVKPYSRLARMRKGERIEEWMLYVPVERFKCIAVLAYRASRPEGVET